MTIRQLERVSNPYGEDLVAVTASTLAVNKTEHAGRVVVLNRAAGIAVTLPNATGSGDVYRFVIGTTISSNTTTIKVAASTAEEMRGRIIGRDTDAEGATGYTWGADDNDDTITFTPNVSGGEVGDHVELMDLASGMWLVSGEIDQSGGSEATPFSATVSA